ncbi:MAG: PEP-CTERM sorting domain-containing protein [Burkholderiales bacterium]|nr:PEP-CTERM sorting domain-containing protein [Burkholderiales bacterium]
MLHRSILCALLVSASALLSPAMASPITVQSVLFDHDHDVLTVGPAAIDPAGNPVSNGDFLIFRGDINATDLPVGNGWDDWTKGLFDFRTDPLYNAFSSLLASGQGKFSAATLRLVLTVGDGNFNTDGVSLENGSFTGQPAIFDQLMNNPPLDNGVSRMVTLNLLDYYTNEQLTNMLSNGSGDFLNDGRIVLQYADDATVSGAALTLTVIPEPATLALVAVALAGCLTLRCRVRVRP